MRRLFCNPAVIYHDVVTSEFADKPPCASDDAGMAAEVSSLEDRLAHKSTVVNNC